MLSDSNTSGKFLNDVFEGAVETSFRNGFVVLGRLTLQGGVESGAWVEQLLELGGSGQLMAAFDAALTLGAETPHAPLGALLAKALQRQGTIELARLIERQVPEQTVSLRGGRMGDRAAY